MDQCIYHKVSGSKIIFLVLYVDDILLASNDLGLLHEVTRFLSQQFDMKDMSEASYVIGIKIERDISQQILGLSQETYINKVLGRFHMKDCLLGTVPFFKGDKFSLDQCQSNDLEKKEMKNIPYASAVRSLMYAQVCTRPDISYAVGMLGGYQRKSCDTLRGLRTTSLHTSDPILWIWLDIKILTLLAALSLESRHLDMSSY